MNLSEQVAEAKIMHWGMYCGICDTCTKEALCSIACPDGGVDNGQTYGEISVVRCKDCKYGEQMCQPWSDIVCTQNRATHCPDWFCADGEKGGEVNG